MLTNADQMEDNKMMQLFHVMNKMEKMREYSHHSVGPWASEYDQSSWMEKMMKKMMMKKMMEKMFDHSSSSYDSEYDSEFSPSMYRRLFKKDQMDYDSYDSDNLMEHKIGNMTCVLRETGILNQQNKLDIRTQKQYF